MNYDFTFLNIKAHTEEEIKAARLFSRELLRRTGRIFEISENAETPKFSFETNEKSQDKDTYSVKQTDDGITITATGIRGFIFGYSHFLRKTVFKNGKITLTENISGEYTPNKKLRGHQIGYNATPNSYDAWTKEQYYRYLLDMMAFGANICELTSDPGKEKINKLEKYDFEELNNSVSRFADELDLDISLWQPNRNSETEGEALARHERVYKNMPRLNIVFPPGGDPGNLPVDEFFSRCEKINKILKKSHPDAELHPSAQAPHSIASWGDDFVKAMNNGATADAVIYGPNHPFPIHELRKRISEKYPMRFYPDISHNLRCEYPVNFLDDDWHFAFANTLSRESVNPRPTEFRTLHRIFSPYTIGSVTYSEGAHDDLNKMVWGSLEFNPDNELRDIILDYARFFMYGTDEEKLTDCIFAIEKSWYGAPEENISIDFAYKAMCELLNDYPSLSGNWRFMLLYFRACCDKIVKMRRCFELKCCKSACFEAENGNIESAIEILRQPFSDDYTALRHELDIIAERLFNLIGMQLDVETYCAEGWERGATLETIDNNITDKAYLLDKLTYALTLSGDKRKHFTDTLLSARKSKPNEIYYSVALHGLNTLGVHQSGEYYMDIQGDCPYTKETPLPMAMTKAFDHYSFDAKFGGFSPDTDYALKVVYKSDKNDSIKHHKITANGVVIYDGVRYGGEKDEFFDEAVLCKGFESAQYTLPKEIFINGTLELNISEPTKGFELCELWIKKLLK